MVATFIELAEQYICDTDKALKDSDTEAKKFDSGKVPLDLFPPEALWEIAKVLMFGAQKYDRHNWRKGMEWSRLYGAALRHLTQWYMKEGPDKESGLSHLAHAACCICFLIVYERLGLGTDDRL